MTAQRPINGNDTHVFYGALGEKQPVERVPCRWLWNEGANSVAMINCQKI